MIFQYLKPNNLPESVRGKGALAVQREIILQNLYVFAFSLITVFFAAILLITAFTGTAPQVFRSGKEGIYIIGYFVFAAFSLIRRIPYTIRAGFIVVMFQLLGVSAFRSFGLSGTGVPFIFSSIVLANLLFGQKTAIVFDCIALAAMAVVGIAMTHNWIPIPPVPVQANSDNPIQWILAGVVMIFTAGVVTSSLFVILRGLNTTLLKSENLTRELEVEQTSLERRVEERSSDLRKRVDQFEIASQIAREIAGETNLERLLNSAVNLIRERFWFYHVGIFINDEKGEYSILRAATGEAGRGMLERNHRLKIGEIGMVGYVASRGEPRISLDVAEDVVHYKNPNLPDTRSEMAIPLRLGDRTIGALDVQSVVANAFSQEDVRILQTIADQLAIAIEKTRLVDQLRHSVEELEISNRTATQKAWRSHLRNTRQKLAYRYHDDRLESQVEETEHAQEAEAKGQPILRIMPGKDSLGKPITVLAVPIKLRNQVLGVVDIHFQSANVSPDLISLIEGTVNRLAVSLENARLLEEIQVRADRERLVSEISSKVRSAADVDTVLRTAIQEIGRSLGVSEVMVQLRKE